MKKIQIFFFLISLSLFTNSCIYILKPSYYKLTRGNWEKDTNWMNFNDMPLLVKDTLSKVYDVYYKANDDSRYQELISIDSSIHINIEYYNDFYNSSILFGYFFKIGNQKFHIDYSQIRTPIVYYNNCLYFPTGQYSVVKQRINKKDYSDYYNKIFVRYKLNKRLVRKINKHSDHLPSSR
jgi:hypothetical protein